jgi:hypothetical protein
MSVDSNNVFLVAGQRSLKIDGGAARFAPEIEQFVVVAPTDVQAYQALAVQEPNISPVGHASLHDYEQAVLKIRAALNAESSSWKVLHAPEVALS